MNVLWVLSRATGLVSLALLTAVVVLGVLVRRRSTAGTGQRFVLVGLHRNASLLAVLLLVVHVATVVLDSYVSVRWYDALVPFLGGYHPFWLGLGTLSVDLVGLLVVTSLLRHRLPPRLWRAVHLSAYAAWPVALVHSVGLGTDMRSAPGLGLAAACTVAVSVAALWRMSVPRPVQPARRADQLLAELRHRPAPDRDLTGSPR